MDDARTMVLRTPADEQAFPQHGCVMEVAYVLLDLPAGLVCDPRGIARDADEPQKGMRALNSFCFAAVYGYK